MLIESEINRYQVGFTFSQILLQQKSLPSGTKEIWGYQYLQDLEGSISAMEVIYRGCFSNFHNILMSKQHTVDNLYRRTCQVIQITCQFLVKKQKDTSSNSIDQYLAGFECEQIYDSILQWFKVQKNITKGKKRNLQDLFHIDRKIALRINKQQEKDKKVQQRKKIFLKMIQKEIPSWINDETIMRDIDKAQQKIREEIKELYENNWNAIWRNFKKKYPGISEQHQTIIALIDPYLRSMNEQLLPQQRRNAKKQVMKFYQSNSGSSSQQNTKDEFENFMRDDCSFSSYQAHQSPQIFTEQSVMIPEVNYEPIEMGQKQLDQGISPSEQDSFSIFFSQAMNYSSVSMTQSYMIGLERYEAQDIIM